MDVVVVNDTAHINGGAAKLAIAEAIGLADRGHSVCFLAAVEPVAEELARHPGIEVICTNQPDLLANPNKLQAFLQGWWNRTASAAARSVATRRNPAETIVHLHIWSRALSSSVARVFLDAGFPTVCTLHDFLLACPTGTFFLHKEQAICHLEPLSTACVSTNCDTRSYTQKLWRVGRNLVQLHHAGIPGRIEDYVVHSDLVRDKMRPYLPKDAAFHHVPVFIEAEKQSPADVAQNEGFAYLGRLVREKGVTLLARAAAAEQLPVTFIGSGALADEVAAANPAAHLTGWCDAAQSVQHMRRSRALVFPSLWYETLGLVVLEAAAQGIPSIVPDTSAAAEIVEHGVTGLHFKSGDEADLRAAMRQIYDPATAAAMGRSAYERFWNSAYFSLDEHIKQLEAVYSGMLHRARVPIPTPDLCVQAATK